MEIYLELENKFGTFRGKVVDLDEESYKKLLDMVKVFYMNGGFELTLEDGTFLVIPPQIVSESILKVKLNGV
jgi:hypothetical protein